MEKFKNQGPVLNASKMKERSQSGAGTCVAAGEGWRILESLLKRTICQLYVLHPYLEIEVTYLSCLVWWFDKSSQ